MIVAAIHTALAMVEPTKALFAEHLPDVRLINIIDESLIQDVISTGSVPPAVKKRLLNYYFSAVDAGADIIFNTCSSVGEIASVARSLESMRKTIEQWILETGDQGQYPEPQAMYDSDMKVYVNQIRRNNPEHAKVIENNIAIMKKWAQKGI